MKPESEVDVSLIDAMLALTPAERLRHNDCMLRTIEELRDGLARTGCMDAPPAVRAA